MQPKNPRQLKELNEIWNNYKYKFSYAEDIDFQDTIDAIKEILKKASIN